jgi:HEPN domain-containing protein
MPNLKLAEEWLAFAAKNLETAMLLNRENHYTDVIAIDIQQTIEKALKALYAFEGIKIPRTHSLEILFGFANQKVNFTGIEIKDIVTISDYYEAERYPGPKYFQPTRHEINHAIEVAQSIYHQLKQYIKVSSAGGTQ